jgi:hypothetical protein
MSAQRQRPIDFATEGLLLAHRVGRNCGIRVQCSAIRMHGIRWPISHHLPARWKGIHSSDGFKNFNDVNIPRKLRDKFLLVFRHEWRWMKSKKFFVLFVKLAIFESTAKGLPEYLDEFLRCAWG